MSLTWRKHPIFDALHTHTHTVVLPRSFPVAQAPHKPWLASKRRCEDKRKNGRRRRSAVVEQLDDSFLFDKKGVSKLLVIPSPTIGLLLGYNINYWIARL